MLERGWNTMKRVFSFKISSGSQTLNKSQQEKIEEDLQRVSDDTLQNIKSYQFPKNLIENSKRLWQNLHVLAVKKFQRSILSWIFFD